jgi:hypothetical protein
MYYGEFNCREDVLREFHIASFDGVVVHAQYDYVDYDGSAIVIYMHDGMFHYVSGGHCSCYGLEGQWEPEAMTAQALLHMIRKGNMPGLSGNSVLAGAIERLNDLVDEDSSASEIECWLRMLL